MNARARVAKLEAAMAALGESDPTYLALQEALKKAKAQSQVRPVEERIASSKVFIERAKKRIGICQEEVARAQQVHSKAQAKLQSEEQGLAEGEARLADLIAESEGSRVEGVPQELREENSDVPSCSPELEAAKRGNASRPGICRIPLSIWSHCRGFVRTTERVRVSPYCMAVVVRMPL